MVRQASLLALVLALGACADGPASTPAPAAEQAGAQDAEAPGGDEAPDEAGEGDEAVAPPAAVAGAFRRGHAAATGLAWSRERDGGYEASFTEGGEAMSVVYAADGTPGEVETEIAVADLPAPVAAALARDHAAATVNEAARILDAGTTTYEAEVSEGGRTRDLMFTADGSPVAAPAD